MCEYFPNADIFTLTWPVTSSVTVTPRSIKYFHSTTLAWLSNAIWILKIGPVVSEIGGGANMSPLGRVVDLPQCVYHWYRPPPQSTNTYYVGKVPVIITSVSMYGLASVYQNPKVHQRCISNTFGIRLANHYHFCRCPYLTWPRSLLTFLS